MSIAPSAAVETVAYLIETRAAILKWRPRSYALSPLLAAVRWGIRRRLLDFAVAREVRGDTQWGAAPLDILFVTSSSAIYIETVKELVRHADTVGLSSGIVLRSSGNGATKEGQMRTLDYLHVTQRAWPQRLYVGLTQKLTAHLRQLRIPDLLMLDSHYGPLNLAFTLRQVIEQTLAANLARSHVFETIMRQLLGSLSPRRVVTAPDRSAEARSAIRQCRLRHIPTWAVQTVYHSRHPRYKPLQADYTSLIDTWSFELFRDHFGADSRRLFVTGSPRMQLTIDDERSAPRRQLLFVCQRGVRENLANLDYVLRNLAGFADAELLVRPHPSKAEQQAGAYRALLSHYPCLSAKVENARPLREVVLQSSVVLTAYSNVGLEAACYGIPVLIINPTGIDYPVAMDEMGVGFRVTSDEQLMTALTRLSGDELFIDELRRAQRSYLDKNAHLLRGDPVERIVNLIVAADLDQARLD